MWDLRLWILTRIASRLTLSFSTFFLFLLLVCLMSHVDADALTWSLHCFYERLETRTTSTMGKKYFGFQDWINWHFYSKRFRPLKTDFLNYIKWSDLININLFKTLNMILDKNFSIFSWICILIQSYHISWAGLVFWSILNIRNPVEKRGKINDRESSRKINSLISSITSRDFQFSIFHSFFAAVIHSYSIQKIIDILSHLLFVCIKLRFEFSHKFSMTKLILQVVWTLISVEFEWKFIKKIQL